MPETDDNQLLRDFTEHQSDAAFAALVTRYVNLVYSVASRQTSHPDAAEEITQAVFIILARKANALGPKTVLSGWLYQTARLTAANFRRSQIRRQQREQEAYMQSVLNESNPDADETWRRIAPLLDDALGKLGKRDRHAIVLRFFENRSLGEVGAALGASEDAAKMRVNRALEKLRRIFSKRGVTLTTTLIAGAVAANSVPAAPVGLAVAVAATAAKGAAVGGSTLALVNGALKLMAWNKAKAGAVVFGSVLLSPILSAIAAYYAVKATLKISKSTPERQARLRFGWKLGIVTVGLAFVTVLPNLINSTQHPWLLAASIVTMALLILAYVGLVLVWSFRHKRELETIRGESQRSKGQ